MNEKELFHLKINRKIFEKEHDINYAILPGDPARVDEIGKMLSGVKPLAYNREYKSLTGKTPMGTEILVCSTGIGGPSAAIAMEELNILGIENFIRVGTCGGISLGVSGGDTVIATSSVRQDGTSLQYAPIEFPATADFEITESLVKAAETLFIHPHIGVIQCKDSFYGQHQPERMPVSENLKEKWESWKKLNVLASEMESSTLFCVASALGLKAGTVLSVVWNQERANAGLPNGEIHDNTMAIKIAIRAIDIIENPSKWNK